MTEQTFDFGNNPVPAHRHKNPNGSEGGWVAETASVAETVHVGKDARIWDRARIWGNARIFDNARIYDNTHIFNNAHIYGNASIWNNARIFDNARICGNAQIYGNVKISRTEQVLTLGPIGSENGTLTAIFDEDGEIWCRRGCFWGTLAEFQKAVEKKPKGDKHRKRYLSIIKLIQRY